MDIEPSAEALRIDLTRDEALRLGIALREGCEALSRAEYYIRTGLAQAEVLELARSLIDHEDMAGPLSLPLNAGVESVENPRRPRRDTGP